MEEISAVRGCRFCGKPIRILNGGRGEWKRYCDEECRKAGRLVTQHAERERRPLCSVDGCERLARSNVAAYCEMHYYRLRRNGVLTILPPAPRAPRSRAPYVDGRGYLRLRDVDHPLANPNRSVFAHRAVAYDSRGGADPACEWCGLLLTWPTAVIDHADNDKLNNEPSNLIVSCHQCNTARGQASAQRFAEGVAVRVLCRLYAAQRAEIVGQVMDAWSDAGCPDPVAAEPGSPYVSIRLFASDVQPKGARGKAA